MWVVSDSQNVINHLDFGSTAWEATMLAINHQVNKEIANLMRHLHLEQADTGRETLSKGLSEKLDRGMVVPPSGDVTVSFV